MKILIKSLCATSLLALAAGCATPVVDKLEGTRPEGSAFNQQLTEEYKLLAKFEADDMQDFIDAGHFAEKGIKAANNEPTSPDPVWSRNLSKEHVAELAQARGRLLETYEHGARDRYPVEAAVAQAKYDCWLEQQEENYQPEHIEACRGAFTAALRSIYSKEHARLSAENQMADASRSAERVAAKPKAAPIAETLIFFDFDKAELRDSEREKIEKVVADAGAIRKPYSIMAIGYTDRAGSYAYNKSLSVRRAESVRKALIDSGVAPSAIIVDGKGELNPLEPTADGVREPDNRRVRVSVQ